MSDIASRGYAHPDVLVSTEWVAAHSGDAGVRIVESNEDTLLYAVGARPGRRARRLDDRPQRSAPPRLHHARRLRGADVAHRRDAGHDGRVLRRQEQLVGVLRLLGVPAVRPHERPGDGRRPAEVGEGAAAARRATCPRFAATSVPRAGARRRARSRLPRRGARAREGERASWSTCAAPRSTPASGCTCPTTRTKARCAAATFPGAKSIPWARAINPEDGTFKTAGRAAGASTSRSRDSTRRGRSIAYCRIGERSSHTWFVLKYLLGFQNVRNYDGSWTEWGNLVSVPIER